tara:strand:- start:691 stop:963 length:273 start_codon:yes stop_codon:yes gene_type:complete
MTPQEIYNECKQLLQRKTELEVKLKKKDSVMSVLKKEFSDLATNKPVIFKNIVSGKIELERLKQFAETAQCVINQVHNPSSQPPEPVVFS